jgi:hypothetical protein
LASIALLLAVIATHVADMISHTDLIARAHIRLFSVATIFISMRIYETGKVIYEKFGMLVVTLTFVIKKIIVWMVLFAIFWVPFTTAFYMLYGYRKFSYDADESVCKNVDKPENVTACEVINIENMYTYNKALYILWIFTFGRDFDQRNDMNQIDPLMTDILIGVFVGVFVLLLVNIFIALLTSTFER